MGEFDVFTENNRTQLSVNYDGTLLAGTLSDTDTMVAYGDNDYPQVYARACNIATGSYSTDVISTEGLEPDGCISANASYYLYDHSGHIEIPVIYQKSTSIWASDPVEYYYIDEFNIDKNNGFTPRAKAEGIAGIIEPVSGSNIASGETVKIRVKNFGTNDISGFNLCYVDTTEIPLDFF